MNNTGKVQLLPVAEVKPGDFPLGSLESRVAARALAERKNETKCVFSIRFMPARDGCADVVKMQNPPRLIRRAEGPDSITELWGWDSAADDVSRS
jgi:hypothetical protein